MQKGTGSFLMLKDIMYSFYSHQNMFSTNLNKCLISLQILASFGCRPLKMVSRSGMEIHKLLIEMTHVYDVHFHKEVDKQQLRDNHPILLLPFSEISSSNNYCLCSLMI